MYKLQREAREQAETIIPGKAVATFVPAEAGAKSSDLKKVGRQVDFRANTSQQGTGPWCLPGQCDTLDKGKDLVLFSPVT